MAIANEYNHVQTGSTIAYKTCYTHHNNVYSNWMPSSSHQSSFHFLHRNSNIHVIIKRLSYMITEIVVHKFIHLKSKTIWMV